MPLRYEDDHSDGRSDASPFLDEEEGRITFHDALDPSKGSDDTSSDNSFNSDEFQQEEKAAITTEMRYRRNKMYALICVCLLILATVIVVPIVVVKTKKTDNKSSEDSTKEPAKTDAPVVPPAENATDAPDAPVTRPPVETDTEAPVEDKDTPAPNDGDNEPAEVDVPPETEENTEEQQEESEAADDDMARPEVERPSEPERPFEPFVPPEPLPSSLQGFSTDVLQAYTSRDALEKDLTAAAEDMVEGILRNNVAMMEEYEAMGDVFMKDGNKDGDKKKTTSRTNDREEDVKEGDSVQEDGTYVYAAYGDRVVVWNRQDGSLVTEETMPSPTADPWGWTNQPWIQTIQLTDNHVFVFAGGYGKYDYGFGKEPPISYGNNETKLIIFTKPTPEEPIMTMVGSQSLNGVHIQSRYMTETGTFHIVTGVDVNTGGFLGDPLSYYHFFPMGLYMNSTEYRQRAAKLAYERLIPDFVEKLMEELLENSGGELPTMMRLNSWQVPEEDSRGRKLYMYWGGYNSDEAIRSYIQVLTIKPQDLPTETFVEDTLKMKSTVAMGPTPWTRVHASGDDIILSMERYNWDPVTQMSDSRLFLLQLKVDANEGTTSFHAATSFAGNFACNYPMDIEGDDLRVAVTHQVYFPYDAVYEMCGMPRGVMMAFYPHGEEEEVCTSEEGWMECHELVMEGCRNVTKSDCPYVYECADEDDGESSTENSVVVLSLSGQDGVMPEKGRVQIGNPHDNVQSISYGETFSYALTTNFGENGPLYVMNLQEPSLLYTLDPSQMEGGIPATYLQPINEAGTLLVGIGMNFTSSMMHHYSEFGVMISVIDVSDPQAPAVLASQVLDGGDEYGSPHTSAQYDAKATQYTDDGLLIIPMSMYPRWNGYGHGGSESIYSEYYNPNITEPAIHSNMDSNAEETPAGFEGFVVLDLSDPVQNGIKELLRINHMGDSGRCHMCNMRGFLPHHRSFWYEDDNSLMTMYSHKVFSTNLDTLTENWGLNISEAGEDNNCCF